MSKGHIESSINLYCRDSIVGEVREERETERDGEKEIERELTLVSN